jgi:hypothetical protein
VISSFVPYKLKTVDTKRSTSANDSLTSGFEKFFARCAEEFAKPGEPPEMERLIEIGAEHGIHFVL